MGRTWDCRAWRTPRSRRVGGWGVQVGGDGGGHLISRQHLTFFGFNFKQIHPDFLLICEAALAEPSAGHSPAAAKTGQGPGPGRVRVEERLSPACRPPTQLRGLQETPAHPAPMADREPEASPALWSGPQLPSWARLSPLPTLLQG